jgi:hypothetical protein
MLDRCRMNKLAAAVTTGLCLLIGAVSPSAAATGRVALNVSKAGIFIGGSSGQGVLHFRGHNYHLSVSGVSAGTIGYAQAILQGPAFNLRRATDITGTYSAVSAGIAVANGPMTTQLQNGNGVVLNLQGRQVGLDLSLALSGINITVVR